MECIRSGAASNQIQLYNRGLSVRDGDYFVFAFRVRCTKPFTISRIALMKESAPYTIYGITPKGHTLFWSDCQPDWLHKKEAAEAESLAFGRVTREISAFAGLIDMWDVLNEPTTGIDYARKVNALTALRIYERYGVVKVIKRAFELARKANPKAILILNDYPVPLDDPNIPFDRFERIVHDCLEEKVPIDAIGIQAHQVMAHREWPVKRTWEICEQFARFGKPLHFTEITIISGWHSNEERQAKLAAQFYTILFSHPAVEAITWWDFTEQPYPGCISAPGAGLLRDDMSPKPAYYALKRLIKDQWWTRTEATTETNGEAHFRGFFGQYKVTTTCAGREVTGVFSFDRSTQRPIEVHMD